MDRITKSLLDEFSREEGISRLAEDKRFEHFSTFLAVSNYHADNFDTDDLVTGSGGDTGIDAIAILVNGSIVNDAELVQELVDTNGYLDATFIFVQAERSTGFDMSKIGQFGFGVSDFFSEKPKLPRNAQVKSAAEIMNAIYERSSKFKRNPTCRLFYVTTGKWQADPNLEARRKAVVEDLKGLGIFRDIEFTPVGADGIQRTYNQTKNAISRDFTFSERTVVPEIPGVKEAYIGLLPAKEFLSLLDDGNGNILRSIFYDNVRDFQDYNTVNSEIKNTLESAQQRARFALMNNGITIIARTLLATGNKFHIEDYQIVNGCQTSHVIFDNQKLLDESVVVPLRLIATDNEEVTASIVKATNRQTEVRAEQLIAISDFQKRLEAYFLTFADGEQLFYERRSRQYNATATEKTRIITPVNLIRAYASIFLEEPHRTTRTFRTLLEQVGKTIFNPTDKLEPYYFSAAALYKLEYLFRNGSLDAKYKAARYHVLLAARLLVKPEAKPKPNSNEMARYCEPLLKIVWDTNKVTKLFEQATEIVGKTAGGNFHRDHIRTQPFTEKLRANCRAAKLR